MPVIGETIASSHNEVVIECYELNNLPPIGSLVEIADILGIVIASETGPIDQGRSPVALGKNGDNVKQSHPELTSLIRSTFKVRLVSKVNGDLVTVPPQMHAPTSPGSTTGEEVLSKSFAHLSLIADLSPQIIIGHIVQLAGKNEELLVKAGQAATRELGRDPEKLRQVLNGLERIA